MSVQSLKEIRGDEGMVMRVGGQGGGVGEAPLDGHPPDTGAWLGNGDTNVCGWSLALSTCSRFFVWRCALYSMCRDEILPLTLKF